MCTRCARIAGAALLAFSITSLSNATLAQATSVTPPAAQTKADVPSSAERELADELMKLASDTPWFDMLGDPSSRTGGQIKRLLKSAETRAVAMRGVLPIALDASRTRAEHDDSLRLLGALLSRAHNDDELDGFLKDEALLPSLALLVTVTRDRAGELIDDFISSRGGSARDLSQEASVQESAHRPEFLLPQCLYLLGNLRAYAAIQSLYEEARDKSQRAIKDDPTLEASLRSRSYGANFPDGMFVWNLAAMKTEWGATHVLRIFREARKSGDNGTLTAALDAMSSLSGSRPELMEELRSMIDEVPEPKKVAIGPDWPESAIESAPYSDAAELFRLLLKRYVSLGIEHYKFTRDLPENHGAGELSWLTNVLNWATRGESQKEPRIVTLFRAGYADMALLDITEPDLLPKLVREILPRVGSGLPQRRGQNFIWALSRLPMPTVGEGVKRRVSNEFVAALAQAWRASADHGYLLDMGVRACGAWARGTPLEQWARESLHTEPHASIVLAHVLGASGQAEFLEFRPEGAVFSGALVDDALRERDRILKMRSDYPPQAHIGLCQQALRNAGVAEEKAAAKVAAFTEKCDPLFADAEVAKFELGKAYRESTLKLIREAMIEACGDAMFLPPESDWTGISYSLFSHHDMWKQTQDAYDYDWNFTKALRIIAIYQRLEGDDPAEVVRAVSDLQQRREDLVWEIGSFDVYAWIPTMIMVYEQAASRFKPDDALAVRKAILGAFAAFRSTMGRNFLDQIKADSSVPETERKYAEHLRPRKLKSLSDEAH